MTPTTASLKTGERLTIRVVYPPLGEYVLADLAGSEDPIFGQGNYYAGRKPWQAERVVAGKQR